MTRTLCIYWADSADRCGATRNPKSGTIGNLRPGNGLLTPRSVVEERSSPLPASFSRPALALDPHAPDAVAWRRASKETASAAGISVRDFEISHLGATMSVGLDAI
jgi:hypothetical protein